MMRIMIDEKGRTGAQLSSPKAMGERENGII
jgi:hypothetical protein